MVEETADEEQVALLNDIVGLLVAAGYFRARIRGLSPFDKIVGGLVWCLEASAVDVDVDLFYDADALSIGQKIAVTERIVRVLERIRCPQRVQPHQIQGLDAAAVYPVVQWLVKKAVETRKERKEATSARGKFEFKKNLQPLLPPALEDGQTFGFSGERLAAVRSVYGPKRTFRRKTPLESGIDEGTRVTSTLMEYGERVLPTGSGDGVLSASGDRTRHPDDATGMESVDAAAMETALAKSFHAAGLSEVTKLTLGAAQRSSMQKAVEQYESAVASAKLPAAPPMTPARLLAKIEETNAAVETAVERRAELKGQMATLRSEYKELEKETNELDIELERIVGVVESPHNRSILNQLDKLLAEHDAIGAREEELRKTAREETARLEAEIAAYQMKRVKGGEVEEDANDETALKEELQLVRRRVDERRLDLAVINKRLASLSRRYDSVPLRAELVQYQRRFVELYDEIAAKHRETKQYYTLYNSLEDQKAYLDRAASLMNSVVETFPQACGGGNDATKEEFVTQLDGILAGIRTSQARLEERRTELESKLSSLREERRTLADAHRTYLKTVKLFQEECRKNEKLIAVLTQREGSV